MGIFRRHVKKKNGRIQQWSNKIRDLSNDRRRTEFYIPFRYNVRSVTRFCAVDEPKKKKIFNKIRDVSHSRRPTNDQQDCRRGLVENFTDVDNGVRFIVFATKEIKLKLYDDGSKETRKSRPSAICFARVRRRRKCKT